jgi:sigma-B regulation protein RsbU (phosphoserine phosphatase)
MRLDENYLGVYILDVSGHSFPAAMVTVSISQALDPFMSQVVKKRVNFPPFYRIVPPSEVLAYLNYEYPVERFEKFFTICYAVLDMRTGKIRYSNAGHPLPVVVRKNGKVEPLEERGTIVGLIDAPFPEAEVILEEGDRLYFYTDGIAEHQNGEGTFFGEDRLYQTLASCVETPLENACKDVISSLWAFAGKSQARDDITLLGIEYRGPSSTCD